MSSSQDSVYPSRQVSPSLPVCSLSGMRFASALSASSSVFYYPQISSYSPVLLASSWVLVLQVRGRLALVVVRLFWLVSCRVALCPVRCENKMESYSFYLCKTSPKLQHGIGTTSS